MPPLNTLFAEAIKTETHKAVARRLRQLATEYALDHGVLVPPLETFRTWVRRAVAAHVSFGSEPFNLEVAWLRWQNRKLLCPAGLHRLIAGNIYMRYKPNPKGGFFKYPECKACRTAKAKHYRERRGPASLPPKVVTLTEEDHANYQRALERVGATGLGYELLRWMRAIGKRYGRPRLRPRLRLAKE